MQSVKYWEREEGMRVGGGARVFATRTELGNGLIIVLVMACIRQSRQNLFDRLKNLSDKFRSQFAAIIAAQRNKPAFRSFWFLFAQHSPTTHPSVERTAEKAFILSGQAVQGRRGQRVDAVSKVKVRSQGRARS